MRACFSGHEIMAGKVTRASVRILPDFVCGPFAIVLQCTEPALFVRVVFGLFPYFFALFCYRTAAAAACHHRGSGIDWRLRR